jgi:hypothetical protein
MTIRPIVTPVPTTCQRIRLALSPCWSPGARARRRESSSAAWPMESSVVVMVGRTTRRPEAR